MNTSATSDAPRYTVGEEWANGLIHGIGAVLSVIGLCMMVAQGERLGNARAVFACTVFGVALILMYSASTLYHAIAHVQSKRILRRVDHIAIFLLIAGTYTPFTLLVLGDTPWGRGLSIGVWLLAAAGVIAEFTALSRHRWVAALVYIGMGWIGIFAFAPLKAHLAMEGVWLVLFGGITYTIGVPFYLWRRLPYHHAIWHLFVLGGSVQHFLAVLLYVVPGAGKGA
jgi:hemolysin III